MRFSICLLVCAFVVSCAPRREGGPREGSAAACQDRIDNDSDGQTDCIDSDCHAFDVCGGPTDGGLRDFAIPDGGGNGAICIDALDVVFVLDVSTSMRNDLDRVRSGLAEVWDAARNLAPAAQFSMVVFVDDALAVNDCAPFQTLAALQSAFDGWRDFCDSNESPVSHASNYDCEENSLDALYLAASTCPWRSPSTRVIIHVTDDTFVENPTRLSGAVTVQHDYASTVSVLVENQIRVGAFAAQSGANCTTGSSTADGFFSTWEGAPSIPDATGGSVWSLAAARNGSLDMGDAITELVTEEFCTLY